MDFDSTRKAWGNQLYGFLKYFGWSRNPYNSQNMQKVNLHSAGNVWRIFEGIRSYYPNNPRSMSNVKFHTAQPASMHLRCIFETSHTASQRHLKEDWFANLWDVSRDIHKRRLLRDVSEISQVFSKTSLSWIWHCNSFASKLMHIHLRHGYLFVYLRVFIFFAKLNWYRKVGLS